MKTINQAAKEYAEKNDISGERLRYFEIAYNAFIAGVNYAQEWISVDDELPPADSRVLVKTTTGYVETRTIKAHNIFNGSLSLTIGGRSITHWRQIELK